MEITPHPFPNPGGKEMPADQRDYKLTGGAAPIPAVYMQDKAWAATMYYQGKQPACGAHAGAWLKALLDDYEKDGQRYTPRFTWVDIKTFDGFAISDGTDMRSIMNSLKNSGALSFDVLANDVTLDLNTYASPSVVTQAMRTQALPNVTANYAFVQDLSFDGLKRAIYENKGVILLLRVGEEFWTAPDGTTSWQEKDILPLRAPTKQLSGHFVVAHSYDEDYIYFANSFSTNWGRNGHGYFGVTYLPYVWGAGTAVDSLENVVVPPYQWARDLYLGSTGPDVTKLQQYLNTHGYPVATTGPGSPGNETNYYGWATMVAVIKYQLARSIFPTFGYFGPKTRAAVNNNHP